MASKFELTSQQEKRINALLEKRVQYNAMEIVPKSFKMIRDSNRETEMAKLIVVSSDYQIFAINFDDINIFLGQCQVLGDAKNMVSYIAPLAAQLPQVPQVQQELQSVKKSDIEKMRDGLMGVFEGIEKEEDDERLNRKLKKANAMQKASAQVLRVAGMELTIRKSLQ